MTWGAHRFCHVGGPGWRGPALWPVSWGEALMGMTSLVATMTISHVCPRTGGTGGRRGAWRGR